MNDNGGLERDTAWSLDPANPADPLQMADPMSPADPMSSADPVDRVDSENATVPMNPGDSMSPVDPADSMTPRVPVAREKPMRTWLWPTLLIFGLVIGVALVVMVLVSSADFGDQPARVTPTPGSCHPFCTETGAPPAP
ncbi:hypothetical protein IU448_03920 [Nocardia flavorosea]|uniref:hypothetical protein n=1 Tax=Nocardia flavorosea TaxID=53429 RepID=UPI001895396C|nr:hypothetical protein [Nocardia flavorosea]MBF6348162.1 hypothetical protein [Nocardia flavorosea]